MKPQFDIRSILIFVVLPIVFAIICSISALLLWLLAPRRFRAARLLLCMPLMGTVVGVPVAIIARMRPDFVVSMGTSCMSVMMLIGFFILGIATLVRAAAGWPAPVERPKRRRDEDVDE